MWWVRRVDFLGLIWFFGGDRLVFWGDRFVWGRRVDALLRVTHPTFNC
jgi:hypothetical protein